MPKLHAHLTKHGITSPQTPLMVEGWFLCLFIDNMPTESVMRVWDSMFFEGWKIIFRVALVK